MSRSVPTTPEKCSSVPLAMLWMFCSSPKRSLAASTTGLAALMVTGIRPDRPPPS